MSFLRLAAKNVFRNRFRTALTVLGVAAAIVAFVLLRTVISAWNYAIDYAATDRVGTRHKVSFINPLPKRYAETVRQVRGVDAATFANWFGAKNPRRPNEFFPSMAVESRTFFDVYNEMSVSPEDHARWMEDRQGAIVGDVLAKKLNLKVGDRITLQGTIYSGDWTYNISGIYTATRKSIDRSQFLFHWDYLNESLPPTRRDNIGWIVSRIDNPSQAATIATAIDRVFDVQDVQTLSMSERAMNASFMGGFSAVLSAMDIVSIIILLILFMILGNTIAMGVRERTNEYGVLRALGFLPRHVAAFILGEASVTGILAGTVGLLLAYPIVHFGMGRWLEENLGEWFPYFRVEPATAVVAFALSVVLGTASAIIPAFRASRLTVTDALRRLD